MTHLVVERLRQRRLDTLQGTSPFRQLRWMHLPDHTRELLRGAAATWIDVPRVPTQRPIAIFMVPVDSLLVEIVARPEDPDDERGLGYTMKIARYMTGLLPAVADRLDPARIAEAFLPQGTTAALPPLVTVAGTLRDGRQRAMAAQIAGVSYLPLFDLALWARSARSSDNRSWAAR